MYPVAIVFSPYTLWTVARSVESFAQRFPQRTIGKGDCALVRVAFFNLSRTNYCVSAEKERERDSLNLYLPFPHPQSREKVREG